MIHPWVFFTPYLLTLFEVEQLNKPYDLLSTQKHVGNPFSWDMNFASSSIDYVHSLVSYPILQCKYTPSAKENILKYCNSMC